jgi:hypothetical protein
MAFMGRRGHCEQFHAGWISLPKKPAVILAGSVIEELLRLYLVHKNIKPAKKTFDSYIS